MSTYAITMLRAGRTYEYEDHRVTARLQKALEVLKALGIEPERTHGTATYFDWPTRRDRHACSLDGTHVSDPAQRCVITWPAWVTDAMLQAAYDLAHDVSTQRGAFNRRPAQVVDRMAQGESYAEAIGWVEVER